MLLGEVSRRKRSKSEDIDNVHSKRRRYTGEEYEAELQVKITARGDINQKLQKVYTRFCCRVEVAEMFLGWTHSSSIVDLSLWILAFLFSSDIISILTCKPQK